MSIISFRKIANFMDPIRPPNRLRGSEQHDYDKSDESQWLQGGSTAKRFAADFGLYHSKSKGLFQVHRGNFNSFREIGERHTGNQSQHHKMLVYNTYLLKVPVVVPSAYDAPERVSRSKEIGKMIGREGYDIACLCEVFDGDDGKRIKSRVESSGGRWADAVGPDSDTYGFDVSGGLKGLIKEQGHRRLLDDDNTEFTDGGEGADEWSNKGWLLMEIDLGPGILDIFLTHTDAGTEDVTSRKEQIKELFGAIKERQKNYPDHITMAVGDFNVYSSTSGKVTLFGVEHNFIPEYEWFLKEMWNECSMRDVWLTRGGKAGATHAFENNHRLCINSGSPECICEDYNQDSYGGDRLDYIFIQDPKPEHTMNIDMSRVKRKPFPRYKPCGDIEPEALFVDVVGMRIRRIHHMSDHLGLHLEFVSSPKL